MIRIEIDRDALMLRMSGHAGYAEVGRDIVCAAASALVYTLAARMQEIAGDGLYARLVSGDALVQMIADGSAHAECLSALDTVAAGLRLLATKYPEHIRLFDHTVSPTGAARERAESEVKP